MRWTTKAKEVRAKRWFALVPVPLDNGYWIWLEWYYYKGWHTWGDGGTYRWQGESSRTFY